MQVFSRTRSLKLGDSDMFIDIQRENFEYLSTALSFVHLNSSSDPLEQETASNLFYLVKL